MNNFNWEVLLSIQRVMFIALLIGDLILRAKIYLEDKKRTKEIEKLAESLEKEFEKNEWDFQLYIYNDIYNLIFDTNNILSN